MARVLSWAAILGFLAALLTGCGSTLRTGGATGTPNIEVPPSATEYSTDAKSDGVRGGGVSSDAEDVLEKHLEARGDDATPDGALADTAAWLLRRAYRKEDLTAPTLGQDAAMRFGFAGEFFGWSLGSFEGNAELIAKLIAQVPKNSVINRYGIVAGQGKDVSIVLGSVHVTLDDFPRAIAAGATLRLKGEVSERYQRSSVHSTNPAGRVREVPMTTRAIDASVAFPEAGIHKLEVLGDGATGPVVLLNVPIYVGVSPSEDEAIATEADPNLTVEDAESILFTLLNEERAKHGAGKVEADAELRSVALGHSVDMATHHFAGHVSPTTGTPEQRVTRAKLRVSKVGECVALNLTPAAAHRALLDSPAHRAGMIDPHFTHVGIGVAFEEIEGGRRIAVTLLLGRRPPSDDSTLSPAAVVEIIQGLRSTLKLPPFRVDPALATAAAAGAATLQSGAAKTIEQAFAASQREIAAAVNRTGVSRRTCQGYFQIIDRHQLTYLDIFKRTDIALIGIGTARVQSDVGPSLALLVISDGGPGKPLKSCD
jgi:uncharacterized protein YkwD